MTAGSIPLLIAVYRHQEAADGLLAELNDGQHGAVAGIVDAATLVKDHEERLRVTDTWHRGTKGLLVGGVVATVIGGLAGPGVATAAGGRVVGGLRGRLRSAPLKFELLSLGDELPAASSLLVAVTDPGWAGGLKSLLDPRATLVLTYELRQEVVDELNLGGNVVFPFRSAAAQPAGARHLAGVGDAGRSVAPLHGQDGIVVSAASLTDEQLPWARRCDA